MKKLIVFLRPYIKESILAPLFKLTEALFDLAVPVIIAAVIDKGIGNSDSGYTVRMCTLLVFTGLLGLLCSVTAQFFAARAATGFASGLRGALFERIQCFSFSQLDSVPSSTLITRMTGDINQVQSGVNLLLRLFLRSPFIVFGALVMAFTIDSGMALVFTVTIALLLLVVFAIMLVTIPLYGRVREKLDAILLTVRENLTGIRVVRAFCREDTEKKDFDEKNSELCRNQLKAGSISGLLNPLTVVIINIAIIMLIYTGALKVDSGNLTQGELVALYNYMSQILIELIKLANLIITVTKSFACASRVSDVLDIPVIKQNEEGKEEKAAKPKEDIKGEISFSHVYFSYGKASGYSLEDISLDILPGQTVGIIGATGAGKSTLVNLIPAFYTPDKGSVTIDKKPVADYSEGELRSIVSIVLQKAELFKGTVRENIRWGKNDASDAEIISALETAQALDAVNGKGGLDAEVAEGGRNFSGGQRQRLSIARALVSKPRVLIFDDSTSALDFTSDAALRQALGRSDSNPTTIIVSQRTSSLIHCDKIFCLEDGRIAAFGTHEELLKNYEGYREIYRLQFPEDAIGATEGGQA